MPHSKEPQQQHRWRKTTAEAPISYVQVITEKIQRVCHCFGIKVVCSSRGKLREALVKVKEPTPELSRKCVVYEVPCSECDHVYIGEMGRTLEKRLSEQRSAVRMTGRTGLQSMHGTKAIK